MTAPADQLPPHADLAWTYVDPVHRDGVWRPVKDDTQARQMRETPDTFALARFAPDGQPATGIRAWRSEQHVVGHALVTYSHAAPDQEQLAPGAQVTKGILDILRPAPRPAKTSPGGYRHRDLRVVDNNTRDYDGGYTVETADETILAGPFASKDDAKTAKTDIIAGRPVTGRS